MMKKPVILFLLTSAAIAVAGYHPGLEDDAYYLAAIKKDLHPALFSRDADFFQLQFQATAFDKLVAWSVRLTHLPLAVDTLIWHFASIFVILWCCHRIAAKCFRETHAQWAAVAMVGALLTIPVSGTGIMLADQHLHPRAVATGAILGAVVASLERKKMLAALLLAFTLSMHAIMASFGISLCLFLGWNRAAGDPNPLMKERQKFAVASMLPLRWLFEPTTAAWRQAAATRTFYFPGRWEWYEWLGIVAPLPLLWCFGRSARRDGTGTMGWISRRLVWFGAFQLLVALFMMLPPAFERLRPLEPMRYLQLIYLFLFLLMGGLTGRYFLKTHVYRWILLFAPLCFGMWFAQRQMYPATAHLELPGLAPRNEWVRAFLWVRNNTPVDSYFAIDPLYMKRPGEDYHGFRALAERGMLADNLKDPGMVARVPRLGARWLREVTAEKNWETFQAADFSRLKQQFGVNWVLLTTPAIAGMQCPYQDDALSICRI
ncbi:MAG: hypothetical protein M3N93_01230 [Acidobacteriota bacterium]|nr:hypothetical protein [Acidobacteriota bacterium]